MRPTMPRISHQRGYTLIELLISVSLGLAMIAVAIQYLVGANASFATSETSQRTQENARFALSILSDEIRMAGYSDPIMGSVPGFFFTAPCGDFNPCTANGDDNASDRLAVWSNPPPDDGTETDCTAAGINANDQVANVFYVETSDDGISSLYCRGYNVSTGAWNAAAQPLVDGIDNIQILFGEITGPNQGHYVSAEAVTSWDQVRSVRIQLLVSTGLERGSAPNIKREDELLDAPSGEYTDTFTRQTFSTTVVINNALI